ncbi:MAG: DMT family transporter [Holosporales bacterium]|nr:DMT family transporter [Holosporales bacterium]
MKNPFSAPCYKGISRDVWKSILWTLLGFALYALSDAFIKHITYLYPVSQVSFLRALLRLIPLLLVSFARHGWKDLKTDCPGQHAVRLCVNFVSTYAVIYVMSQEPLTTVYVIYYTAPLFMVLFSQWILRENANGWQWASIFLGFVGVVIAIRPSTIVMAPLSFAVMVVGILSAALNKTLMRRLTRTESSLTIAIYPNIFMVLVLAPFVLTSWKPLSWEHWGLFLLIGGIVALAQYVITHALRFATLSVLAPLDYTTFVWGAFFDVLFWGVTPEPPVLLGASVIIGSNLLILRAKKRTSAP